MAVAGIKVNASHATDLISLESAEVPELGSLRSSWYIFGPLLTQCLKSL